MKKLIIWLDDKRPMPKEYNYWAKTAEECIGLIKKGRVEFISLDSDLGTGMTEGKKVAQYIEQAYLSGDIEYVDFWPHTSNPASFEEILACKRSIIKHKL